MLLHSNIEDNFTGRRQLHQLIKEKGIAFAGNKRLKIYGTLSCKSGKRMKRENRIFFINEREAIAQGFRPCLHCMGKRNKL
jgi:methylphosphotriester-DNA--protein-cysteine methyltransferase